MDIKEQEKKNITELYHYMCASEGVKPLKLYFGNVGRGGALCAYKKLRNGKITSLYIKIDLCRICIGAAWVLCHEMAHQLEIDENCNATHNYKFKSREKKLIKKYTNCSHAKKLIF